MRVTVAHLVIGNTSNEGLLAYSMGSVTSVRLMDMKQHRKPES